MTSDNRTRNRSSRLKVLELIFFVARISRLKSSIINSDHKAPEQKLCAYYSDRFNEDIHQWNISTTNKREIISNGFHLGFLNFSLCVNGLEITPLGIENLKKS